MTAAEDSETLDGIWEHSKNEKSSKPYTWSELLEKIVWRNLALLVLYHIAFIAALSSYIVGFHSTPAKTLTVLWAMVFGASAGVGATAGAHRLWSHRSYKANLPLRILLMILFSGMGFNPLYYWIRDHRIHHKYSETDADPHNAKRGFLYSHWGWLIMKRHPECLRRGKEVDMSDIDADSVVMFQKKYEVPLKVAFCFIIPTVIPIIFWNETVLHAILIHNFIRYVSLLNFTFCVNSISHLWGNRPYNRLINPADNVVISMLVFGDGWHNYHHTFPWDYRSGEMPWMNVNFTTGFIRVMAKLGWAYDLREPSPELVERVISHIGYKSKIGKVH